MTVECRSDRRIGHEPCPIAQNLQSPRNTRFHSSAHYQPVERRITLGLDGFKKVRHQGRLCKPLPLYLKNETYKSISFN